MEAGRRRGNSNTETASMRLAVLTVACALATGGVVRALVPPGPPGFPDGSVRAGVLLIVGAALIGATLRGLERRRVVMEIALAAMLSGWVLFWTEAWAAAALSAAAWLVPWAWVLPLRAVGRPGLARLGYLAAAAVLFGTPWLASPAWSDLPAWVLEWNPLIRLHGSVLEEDWLHGPTLYPRVGERYYVYPDAGAGLVWPLLTAGAAVALALTPGLRRRRRYKGSVPKQD